MLLISALALGLIETSSAGFNLVPAGSVTATAFAATVTITATATATATAAAAASTNAAQHFGGGNVWRRGSAAAERGRTASNSIDNTVINVIIRERDKAADATEEEEEDQKQKQKQNELNDIKYIDNTMPSTGVNAAGVGVGALINSAGGSSVSDGGGGGGGVGLGGSGSIITSSGTLIAQTTAGTSAAGGTITWDNNGTLRSLNPGDWSIEQCLMWQQPHHLYFQLGNAFLFLAFLAPHGPFGMLWMRALLFIGCILMGMYGYLIECTPDVVLWSGLGLGVNFVYLIVVLCRLRPVQFEKEIEAVYTSLFKPLRVTRHQFKKVLNCMKVIRSLKYQEVYAQEKVTKVDSLSLVLSGKLVVSQHQRALHIVFPHQFLDSPEWFGVSTDDYFQVSIMAMEESRVLIWHRDKLKLSIMTEPFLQTVFDHILGRDVVKKLMQVTQVSESIASNGFLPSGGYAEDAEDKPMLILKKSVDVGHGLTALINRQLQEEHVPLLGRTYYASTPPLCAVVMPRKRSASNSNNNGGSGLVDDDNCVAGTAAARYELNSGDNDEMATTASAYAAN